MHGEREDEGVETEDVLVHEEREGVCIWKGWSVHAWGEGG